MDSSMGTKRLSAIVIAKGAPNRTSTGMVSMCAIALSEEMGLVRLYPLTFEENANVSVWSTIEVTARRSPTDNRKESWRVESTVVVGKIDSPQAKSEILDNCVLESGIVDPIVFQNKHLASVAIIKTDLPVGCGLKPRDAKFEAQADDESWCLMQSDHPFKPYLLWTSIQGSNHETHIVAQEAYYGMAKNAASPFRIFENMRIGDPDYQHWIVLGNMKDRRNVWVCPHIHRLKKTGFSTALSFMTNDGRVGDWPYLTQGAVNAKDAGPQMTLPFII